MKSTILRGLLAMTVPLALVAGATAAEQPSRLASPDAGAMCAEMPARHDAAARQVN